MSDDITYGLTDSGLVIKTLAVIRLELQNALQAAFGASIDLGDKSIFGQIVGILAEREALIWELLEVVVSSQDPDAATGASLDSLCALTGTLRPSATFSTVMLTLTGTPSTVVPSGSQVTTTSTAQNFATDLDATIVSVPNYAAGAYVPGNRVTSAGNVYQCTVGGTSTAVLVPTTTDADIADTPVHWTYLGSGTGAVDQSATAVNVGAVTAVSRDVTTIASSVLGWTSVINVLDATVGSPVATDAALRVLRVQELAGDGNGTVDALLAHLLQLAGVIAVTVFENITDVTDADGMPPHSVEALVRTTWSPSTSADQILVDTIFASVVAGPATYGSSSGTSTDTQDVAHTVYFSRPIEIPIYVAISITVDPDEYPTDGDAQVANAIVAWANGFSTGKDAVSSGVSAQAFQVDGVLDVTVCNIGLAPSPSTSTTIPISLRQIATFDTSRIAVTSTDGTP